MKLRLRPEDAARLRAAAAKAQRENPAITGVSEYVSLLLDARGQSSFADASTHGALATMADVSQTMTALSEEAQRCRGELGRAFGLLKNLFETPASVVQAERHAHACAAAVRDARAAIAGVETAIAAISEQLAPIRRELVPLLKRLAVTYAGELEA